MTPERDEATEKTAKSLVANATYSADATDGVVSVIGFGAATLLLNIGVGGITFTGTNKIDFHLQHGNASDGSDLTDVTDADLIKDSLAATTVTGGIVRSLQAAHAAADIQVLGYIGGKSYLKMTADFSGTHGTGTPLAVSIVAERPDFQGAA